MARTRRHRGKGEAPPLEVFGPATRAWFTAALGEPTRVQQEGWRPISRGQHALLLAPTGSGKTLAAFLWCIDRLTRLPPDALAGVRVIYISPLKALAYDVDRNLRAPLLGIERAAQDLGVPLRRVDVSVRTGDSSARDRRRYLQEPGDILITTPESLYLLLGSAARETLRLVDTVIVDEIHALAPTKRGAHLALSLERLVELCGHEPQRIGLSATQRPLDEVARYLAGSRPVSIVDASEPPRLDLTIEVPLEDLAHPPAPPPPKRARNATPQDPASADRGGVWPAIHPRLLELIRSHRSTILFTNSRRLCERLAQRLNELDAESAAPSDEKSADLLRPHQDHGTLVHAHQEAREPLVRAHHGSVSRPQREEIEAMLKDGRLRAIVATSSLELGIDMGAVDLVIQIESPGSVARGLQRIGRAGHQVGARSEGRMFPKFRGDLLETAVVARRMLDGQIEPVTIPMNPLDVLAQQIVAICAKDSWTVARLEALIRRAYSYASLSRGVLVALLDMLSGRYPTDDFAELRPRINWDRAADTLTSRRDAALLAIVNAGTIPDRGLYGVYIGQDGPRVGELDEEMVHESRVGQTFLLGATSWRILEITRDRVIVAPAPGEPGRMPFWRGEGPGRPIDLGRALGAFVAALGAKPEAEALAWLARDYRLDERAARNLWRYIDEQRQATGALPTDKTIVVERFRDELGDWRICILSPFGARVHAPWALALEARLASGVGPGGGPAEGADVQALWSDDGIVLRLADPGDERALPVLRALLPEPEEVEELVLAELGRSALFATHFRENAARALLLPRRRPGTRTPLWAQRLRAQSLMAAAIKHPDFPIVLETYRECLHDVFDVPALIGLLAAIRAREVRVVEVETRSASPFARSLVFAYVAAYLYEGDAPLAERKAQALTLDRDLLRELLGQEELSELIDPEVLDEVERELQCLVEDRRARHADALHDLLRRLGDLDEPEIAARCDVEPAPLLAELERGGRAVRVRLDGATTGELPRWIAVEDFARYRAALGVAPPSSPIAAVFLETPVDPSTSPLTSLVARYARTHGPFSSLALAARFHQSTAQIEAALRQLVEAGRVVEGELHPGEPQRRYCDKDVLRQVRRRTLARLRNQVAPVEAAVLARFLPRWQGVGASGRGAARLREVVAQLEGASLPFSELERSILPARVGDFHPRLLDELGALGEVVWVGRGQLGGGDGRIALVRRERAATLLDAPMLADEAPPLERALLDCLVTRGASFFAQLQNACNDVTTDELLDALWGLVWQGLVTNDTFQPLRARGLPRRRRSGRASWFEAGGRWSAVSELCNAAISDTARAHARALLLLERYGVVTREVAAAEGIAGGFATVAPVLRAMEEAGKARRGYFIEGLAGMQFAHAGAVDRLRGQRDGAEGVDEEPTGAGLGQSIAAGGDVVVLAAVDPANAYGTLLPWPSEAGRGDGDGRASTRSSPRRAAGADVVLVRGVPVFYLEPGGRKLRYFPGSLDEEATDAGTLALRLLAQRQRHGELRIEQINGVAALLSEHARWFERAGFRAQPNSLVLQATLDTPAPRRQP